MNKDLGIFLFLFLPFLVGVILICWPEKKKKTKTLFKFPPPYQEKPLEMWEEPVNSIIAGPSIAETYVRTKSFEQDYKRIKEISYYQKVRLGMQVRLGQIDYPEYYQQYDDLLKWEMEQWKKLYAK